MQTCHLNSRGSSFKEEFVLPCLSIRPRAQAWECLVSIYKHPVFHTGSTDHGLACQGICSFVYLVARLGMLFTKKLFRICHYIPAQNKHVNHLYIAILHNILLEIIPPITPLHMHARSCQMICSFSIGMIAVGVTSHAEKPRFCLDTCKRVTTLGVSLLNHSSTSKARVIHANAWCPPAVEVQAMKYDRSTDQL